MDAHRKESCLATYIYVGVVSLVVLAASEIHASATINDLSIKRTHNGEPRVLAPSLSMAPLSAVHSSVRVHMTQPFITSGHVGIGGDFASVFDPEDYLSMVNAIDEATVVLRAHLVLEEFLNIWASRVTRTEDLFAGAFVQFKIKLLVCRNLGLATEYFEILDKFNDVRNRYSHRRKYVLEANALESLREKVNALKSDHPLLPCEHFEIYLQGTDGSGQRRQFSYTWATADAKKRLAIVQVILVLKFVQWMQSEFNARGIKYTLVVLPMPQSSAP